MATELGVGYVSILPSTRGFQSALNRQISGSGAVAGAKVSEGFGSALLGGIRSTVATAAKVVKGLAVTGGVGAALFVGASLKKGYDRLSTIDDATRSLTVSLGSGAKASALLGETLDVVKGTPFNLANFADAAQNLAAMGVNAAVIPDQLTAIADVASTKGSAANEWASRLATQFGQIKSQGKIMGQDILQMAQAGVPALQILANHYGVTTGQMQKMVSEGMVPADEGMAALTAGIENGSKGIAGFTPKMAGMAKGLAQGTSGSVMNLGAAISRFGAGLMAPIFEKAPKILNALSTWLDQVGGALAAVTRRMVNSKTGNDIFQRILDGITNSGPKVAALVLTMTARLSSLIQTVKGSAAFQTFTDKLSSLKSIDFGAKLGQLGDLLKTKVMPALSDLKSSGPSLLTFLSNLKKATATSGKGILIGAVASLPAFVTLVNTITGLVAKVPPNVLVALFGAIATFKVAKGAADGVNGIATAVKGAKSSLETFGKASGSIGKVTSALKGISTKSLTSLKSGFETVGIKALYAKDKIASGATAIANFGKKSATAAVGIAKTVAQFVAQKAAMVGAKIAELALAAAKKVSAAAQWLLNAAMSANPITLIVIGIAALIAGFVLAYQKIGWFRDFVQGAFRIIKTVILGVFNWVKTNWPLLLAILTGPIGLAVLLITKNWDTIKNAFTAVKNWISDRVGDIVGFITGIPGRIGHTVSTMWNGLKTGITSAKNWVEDRINDVVSFVTSLPRRIASSVAGAFDGIRDAFKSALNWVIRKWNAFHLPSVHVPGTDINIGGMGLPHIDELHTGGMVPGPASYEPIYRLQGGEMVLSRDQVKALGTAPQPRGGVTFGPTYVTDPTDVDTLFQKAGWALARGAL